jgi:hypothetical protein
MGNGPKKAGKKMTTVETTKAIRAELKATFPTYKFSVRKVYCGVVHIDYNGDKSIREVINEIAKKFTGWSEFQTEYVFVNPCGVISERKVA